MAIMEYKITGENLPVVVCYLQQGETVKTQNGGMAWMSPNISMKTKSNGILKGFARNFAGESFFQNNYTCENGVGTIAFASSFPGEIRAYDVSNGDIIVQKRSFLASEISVNLSVCFQKKLSGGLFGGEGFVMQRMSGKGIVFMEFDGSVTEYTLNAGQSILVDTGYVGAMTGSCTMTAKLVKGIKNKLVGGEGMFLTKVTGPGKVYLQSMPIFKLGEVFES